MHRLRQITSASRTSRADGVGRLRGGTAEAGRLSWPLRWFPCPASFSVEDLPGALRQQQILGECQCGRTACRDPCLRRSDRHPPGRTPRRGTPPQLQPRRDDLRPVALRAGCGPQTRRTAQRRAIQGLGAAGPRWSGCDADSPGPTMVIVRWSPSSLPCWASLCKRGGAGIFDPSVLSMSCSQEDTPAPWLGLVARNRR